MTSFYSFMQQSPVERARIYHQWASETRDNDPDLAQIYDTTAAELETP